MAIVENYDSHKLKAVRKNESNADADERQLFLFSLCDCPDSSSHHQNFPYPASHREENDQALFALVSSDPLCWLGHIAKMLAPYTLTLYPSFVSDVRHSFQTAVLSYFKRTLFNQPPLQHTRSPRLNSIDFPKTYLTSCRLHPVKGNGRGVWPAQ